MQFASPLVPFDLLNYAKGLTGIRFGSFVLASLVGMRPATAAFAFVGASARGRRPGFPGWGWWAFAVSSKLLAAAVIG